MTVRFDNERLAVAIADGEHAPGWVLEHDAAMAVLLDLRDARRDLALEGAIYGRANQVRAAWALRSTQPESMQPAIDRTGRGTMTDKHEAMAREFRAKPPSFGAHDHGWAHHDCARCDADLAALLRKVEQEVRDEVSAIMESACRKAGLIFGSPLHQDPAEGFEAAVVEAFSQRCALERERCAKVADDNADRVRRAKKAALGRGRKLVASHRQSDIETSERIAAAIRARGAKEDAE